MKEFITIGYSYNELNDKAKEKVKEWYLNDPIRCDIFHDNVVEFLHDEFPNSSLRVNFSLCYCQGDGFNIEGVLDLCDFLDKWKADSTQKEKMELYLDNIDSRFTFRINDRYSYSCKFIDKEFIDGTINIIVEELECAEIEDVDIALIKDFYIAMLDYFEKLDKQFESKGYNYLYDCDDEEVEDICEANDYYFTEDGELI